MAAVAVTAGTQRYTVWGDEQVCHLALTSVDDGDTFAAGSLGFAIIHNCVFTPTTAVLVVPTFSGTTITFKVGSGSVAGQLSIWGKP
jgi:hypothetical protein